MCKNTVVKLHAEQYEETWRAPHQRYHILLWDLYHKGMLLVTPAPTVRTSFQSYDTVAEIPHCYRGPFKNSLKSVPGGCK